MGRTIVLCRHFDQRRQEPCNCCYSSNKFRPRQTEREECFSRWECVARLLRSSAARTKKTASRERGNQHAVKPTEKEPHHHDRGSSHPDGSRGCRFVVAI